MQITSWSFKVWSSWTETILSNKNNSQFHLESPKQETGTVQQAYASSQLILASSQGLTWVCLRTLTPPDPARQMRRLQSREAPDKAHTVTRAWIWNPLSAPLKPGAFPITLMLAPLNVSVEHKGFPRYDVIKKNPRDDQRKLQNLSSWRVSISPSIILLLIDYCHYRYAAYHAPLSMGFPGKSTYK